MDKNDTSTIEKRFRELADRAYKENRYVFTDFLDMSQLSAFYDMERELSYSGVRVFGGADGTERCMIRFGNAEALGYDMDFPIVLLHISPVQAKFADKLTHRDFLGSVIGLGIERTKLGDIVVVDNTAYIFVSDTISGYIMESLNYVKHTRVKVELCDEVPAEISPKLEEMSLIVSSNRLDAIIAKVYNISRDKSIDLISEGKTFVNGREMTGNAKSLKPGDVVSVRGKGRFLFDGEGAATRKNKLYIRVKVYR